MPGLGFQTCGDKSIAGYECSDWETSTKRLTDDQDIGLNIVEIAGPRRAATAQSGLDFIDDQQDAALATHLLNACVVVLLENAVTIRALHDFNDESRYLTRTTAVEIGLQRVNCCRTTVCSRS